MLLRYTRLRYTRLHISPFAMSQRTIDRFFGRPASQMPPPSPDDDDEKDHDAAAEKTPPTKFARLMESNGLTPEQLERMERNHEEAKMKLLNKKRTTATGGPDLVQANSGEASSLRLYRLMDDSWRSILNEYMLLPAFRKLDEFVTRERAQGKIFPAEDHVFSAFRSCKLPDLKVVIIGQDPYHGERQAHGLCFSVQRGIPPPPSLINIYKELAEDIPGFRIPRHGYLQSWAEQGVLLLNAVLTVQAHKANSHANRGWELFTDEVINKINSREKGIVFLLWGRNAQLKGRRIDAKRHLVLTAKHPSPMAAANGGWFGCRHFSKTNEYLQRTGKTPIDWQLPE